MVDTHSFAPTIFFDKLNHHNPPHIDLLFRTEPDRLAGHSDSSDIFRPHHNSDSRS
jgi:hypothetical protein